MSQTNNQFQIDKHTFVNFNSRVTQDIHQMYDTLKLLNTMPSVEEYDNVTYIPDFNDEGISYELLAYGKGFKGALYAQNHQIIENSRIKRENIYATEILEPSVLESFEKQGMEFVDKRMIYLGVLFEQYGHFLSESLCRFWSLSENCNQ